MAPPRIPSSSRTDRRGHPPPDRVRPFASTLPRLGPGRARPASEAAAARGLRRLTPLGETLPHLTTLAAPASESPPSG